MDGPGAVHVYNLCMCLHHYYMYMSQLVFMLAASLHPCQYKRGLVGKGCYWGKQDQEKKGDEGTLYKRQIAWTNDSLNKCAANTSNYPLKIRVQPEHVSIKLLLVPNVFPESTWLTVIVVTGDFLPFPYRECRRVLYRVDKELLCIRLSCLNSAKCAAWNVHLIDSYLTAVYTMSTYTVK